jgi:ethanolamine phosphate phosphodiesterase
MFTVLHTDNYLKRSHIQLQKTLHPDTVFFLGDLFDGGREWATRQGSSEDPDLAEGRPKQEQALLKKWRRKYRDDFWLKEYNRFGRIFFKHWNEGGGEPGPGQRGRKVIASLPGNHDLGFGANIKIPVRNRFQAYFGDTNRVDVIGNHTFVSVDTVSLSAGAGDQPGADTKDIYRPVEEFLENIQPLKRRAVARELRYQNGDLMELRQAHEVIDLEKANYSSLPTLDPGRGALGFPTILLTHVPLYREPGTPCGPLREHWPPTPPLHGQTAAVIPDERNAISISKGYQYQNVLGERDSVHLISKIGDIVSVFSGDDHDYCEIVHGADKMNVREITVKSMSWAMGVRRPGFLMLSMWNPIDPTGRPIGTQGGGHGTTSSPSFTTTIERHLCLLPDQLGIFMRYGAFIIITLLALSVRAILTPLFNLTPFSPPPQFSNTNLASLLPLSVKRSHNCEDSLSHRIAGIGPVYHTSNTSTSSTSSAGTASLAPRSTAARTRSVSLAGGYGLPAHQTKNHTPPPQPPLINSAKNAWADRYDEEDGQRGGAGCDDFGRKGDKGSAIRSNGKLTPMQVVLREAWTSIWRVAWVVGLWYFYLARYG